MLKTVLFLVMGAFLAFRWAGALRASVVTKLVALPTIMLTLWFVPMHLLGWVSLLTRQPVVTPGKAALLLLPLLVVEAIAFRRRHVDWTVPWGRLKELTPPSWLLLLPLAGIFGWIFRFGWGHPPIGWDNMHYHLPRALNFMQLATLTEYFPPPGTTLVEVENALGYNACHAYPGNWSLYLSLLTRLDHESLLTLAQFPFLVLGGLVVYRFSRRLGTSITAALVAVAVACTGPLPLAQSIVPYTDLFCAVFLLSTLLFLLEPPIGRSVPMLTLAGLALGIAVGAKSTSLVYALLLGLMALGLLAYHLRQTPRRASALVALFAGMALLPSAFWFGQNWLLYGSPVVPWQLKIAGIILFPGKDPALFDLANEWVYVSTRKDWLTYPWTEKFNNESGFGWLWTTVLPLSAAGLLWGLLAEKDRERKLGVALLGVFGLCSLVFWWKMTHHEPRYMMQILGIVAVLGAYAFHRLQPWARTAALVVVLLGLAGNAFTSQETLNYRKTAGWTRNDYVASISRSPTAFLDYLDSSPAMRIFNEKHGLVESTVVSYGLYGSRFQHQVLEDQNLVVPSVDETRRNLLARGVNHLFIIAKSEDPYLERYIPDHGFEVRFQEHKDGLVHSLYWIRSD